MKQPAEEVLSSLITLDLPGFMRGWTSKITLIPCLPVEVSRLITQLMHHEFKHILYNKYWLFAPCCVSPPGRWSCPSPTSLPQTWFWFLRALMQWTVTLHPWEDTNSQPSVSSGRSHSVKLKAPLICMLSTAFIMHFILSVSAMQLLTDRLTHTGAQSKHTCLCLFCASDFCIQTGNLGVPTKSFSKTTLQIPERAGVLVVKGLIWVV